ncbi:2-succinyl-5-enolpyruvyl-6-hydroxy-3-cyclohexene-1-carboxylic-acid synthase [Owenweeksia hongkongensis]|uniref:2-succinyl-5-enolpyruvyl-6-hydroxy-3- cyclohexene-1-carboxylic-acid synthase n=1 Tax=Owenweeksia hongkongensis TaxID=253245 RepID=UPI0005A219D8|nr:2-succinyl-5-enolpyruvyl-6-hydroxy-3-cyclohexene-1-carboxylic-acid synthase [Owenweeksia hongkongensis]
MKTSDKLNAQYLGQLLKQHNCKTVVIAPGSRNAPLIITFTNDSDYRCISVPDERVAAFTAMGLTLEKREPVAVICSSGSAAVNFYPAVVEAFYQKLPLVVITADRPIELIDQGIGQAIRQPNVFTTHIVKDFDLIREPADELAKNFNQRSINEALLATKHGPVHINVPFDEPLYGTTEEQVEAQYIDETLGNRTLSNTKVEQLSSIWNEAPKIWVLAGQMLPDSELEEILTSLNQKSPFLIFSESLSNLHCACNIHSIDRLINTISEEEKEALCPDLLISIGGEVVSKMVKKFLRTFKPKHHWYVNEATEFQDTYGALTDHVQVHPALFFKDLMGFTKPKSSDYRDDFLAKDQKRMAKHAEFVNKAQFSDMAAFREILKHLPKDSILHCANSTSIRYSQLFDHEESILHYANRGTSGIDGCTSTAIGHAITTDKMVTLITGDVAFLYDSNAFWNDELPDNLRVIVLNNNGGNIFRIIEGPDKNEDFERFQETIHNVKLQGVATTFGLSFTSVSDEGKLQQVLSSFFAPEGGIKVLEIQTPRIESPEVLKNYWAFLRNGFK